MDRISSWRPSAAILAAQFYMRIEDEGALDKILSGFGAQKFFWRIYAHSLLTRATGVERLDVKAQKIFLNQKPQRNMWSAFPSSKHVWS